MFKKPKKETQVQEGLGRSRQILVGPGGMGQGGLEESRWVLAGLSGSRRSK